MVDVVLSKEYGRSSSPRIRLTRLLFPELVSPLNVLTAYYWMDHVVFFKLVAHINVAIH